MSSSDAESREPSRPRKSLPYWGFALIVVAYLAIIQGGGTLMARVSGADDDFTTTRGVLLNMWIPLGAALVFTYAVVAFLRWGRPVLVDDRPVQRWVRIVPVVLVVSILVAIDYADLMEKSFTYVVVLLVATQMVGWGEEGMFRGIGVTTLRSHGLTEGKVALWSSLIFGAVHLTNAIGRGTGCDPASHRGELRRVLLLPHPTLLRRQRPQLRPARALRLLPADAEPSSSSTSRRTSAPRRRSSPTW